MGEGEDEHQVEEQFQGRDALLELFFDPDSRQTFPIGAVHRVHLPSLS